MTRKYWLDLFTGETWEEFLANDAKVSGFRENRKKMATKVQPGDYFICYLTGVSRFVGVLEVQSTWYRDETPIWKRETFPIRFKVKIILQLEPKTAVPILALRDKLSIFRNIKPDQQWSGFFRGSPAQFKPDDGEIIVEAIRQASVSPIERKYDKRKYLRYPKIYPSAKSAKARVVQPRSESEQYEEEEAKVTHEEIQWTLLKLGADLGMDVWVARNDLNKEFDGMTFRDMKNIRDKLPMQFDAKTDSIIEHIDVLWLQGDTFIAAFEVEHTTQIYSGLLRMSDLIAMQPNLKIDSYIVAPDERREKVLEEMTRPTFKKLKTPLHHLCRFIPYSKLKDEINHYGNRIKYLQPEFINDIAESYDVS